ncbi:MAG: sulfotransferase [Gammaproteobacteria bacterium]|nr:sulfotransferase [Gammaproteobacteria bacterium]MBU1776437.1 sulfotransferase [Gammaproteobacteria bacterium]
MKPTFILGVGCQKGGTTWLFRYLETHPDVMMSPTKEMHIFDAMFIPEVFGLFYKQSLSKAHAELTRVINDKHYLPHLNANLRHELDRLNIYHDLSGYSHYFSRLASSREGIKAVGEISPTYAALGVEHYGRIKTLLSDFHLKIIFLMRDPIDRIQSQQRMIAKGNARGRVQNPINLHGIDFYTNKNVALRTNYDKTITNLESVFDPNDIFYGFYETLFETSEIGRLCDFLNIDHVPADFSKRVNSAPKLEQEANKEVVAQARRYYDSVYSFCANRFSEEFIKRIWANYSV